MMTAEPVTEPTNEAPPPAPPPAHRTWGEALSDLEQRKGETRLVPCPELGLEVRVRGLSRAEIFHIARVATNPKTGLGDQALADRETVKYGIVEPPITEGEYRALTHLPAATPALRRIHDAISELSTGLTTTTATTNGAASEEALAASEARFRG